MKKLLYILLFIPFIGFSQNYLTDGSGNYLTDGSGNYLFQPSDVWNNEHYCNIDATNEYIDFGIPPLNVGTNDYSVSFWVYMPSSYAGTHVFMLSQYQTASERWYFRMKSPNILHVYFIYGGVTQYSAASTATFNLDAWNHVAVTSVRGGASIFYLNNTKKTGGTSGTADIAFTSSVHTGYYSALPSKLLKLDEIAIWNGTVITDADVALLYASGNPENAIQASTITGLTYYYDFENITSFPNMPNVINPGTGDGTYIDGEGDEIETY